MKKSQFSDNCQWHLVKHGLLVLVGVFRTDSQLRTASVRVVPQGSNKVCGGTGPLGCKHLGSKFCASWGGKNGRDGIGYTRISIIYTCTYVCLYIFIYIYDILHIYNNQYSSFVTKNGCSIINMHMYLLLFSTDIPGFCNPQQ